jgi:hypothetical protein
MSQGHSQAAALQLLQQQQGQSPQPTPTMLPPHHAQNAAAYFQQYYQTPYPNMPQFMNATPQQMSMMAASMMPTPTLIGNAPSANNTSTGSSSGMATPNSSVSAGPIYKISNSQASTGDNASTNANNAGSKKGKRGERIEFGRFIIHNTSVVTAVVSVQRTEQPNIGQQQQQQQQQSMQGGHHMVFPAQPIRYYSPEYMTQRRSPPFHPLLHLSFERSQKPRRNRCNCNRSHFSIP